MKAFTKDTVEYQIFFEIWNYFKKYAKCEMTDSFWEELKNEGNRICKKFHSPFVMDLVLCCMEEISRRREKEKEVL